MSAEWGAECLLTFIVASIITTFPSGHPQCGPWSLVGETYRFGRHRAVIILPEHFLDE